MKRSFLTVEAAQAESKDYQSPALVAEFRSYLLAATVSCTSIAGMVRPTTAAI